MSETRVSKRMARLSPSMTFAMNALSNELKAKGIDVVNMSLGEPDFNTPEHVKAAAREALDENYTHYTPVPGSVSLKNAIIGYVLIFVLVVLLRLTIDPLTQWMQKF